jgi:hypothetical protein
MEVFMNLRTKSLFPYAGGMNCVDIFGYVSHGIPGIEIVGLGKHSRPLKEKFVYLTRDLNLKLPKRRFVICVEGDIESKKFQNEEFRYLELPMLVMLWSLAGHLPFQQLDDCFCSGKVSVEGHIESIDYNESIQNLLLEWLQDEADSIFKIIAPDKSEINDQFYHLSIEGLWKHLNQRQIDDL